VRCFQPGTEPSTGTDTIQTAEKDGRDFHPGYNYCLWWQDHFQEFIYFSVADGQLSPPPAKGRWWQQSKCWCPAERADLTPTNPDLQNQHELHWFLFSLSFFHPGMC